MPLEKDDIKLWLARIGKDRGWLAEKCGVSKNTVNNWLSTSVALSDRVVGQIETLMREAVTLPQNAHVPPPTFVPVPTPVDEFLEWEKVAMAEGMTLSEWALEAVRKAYREAQKEPETVVQLPVLHNDQKTTLKAAEDSPKFGKANTKTADGETSAHTSAQPPKSGSQRKTA